MNLKYGFATKCPLQSTDMTLLAELGVPIELLATDILLLGSITSSGRSITSVERSAQMKLPSSGRSGMSVAGTVERSLTSSVRSGMFLLVQMYVHLREWNINFLLIKGVIHPLIHIEKQWPVVGGLHPDTYDNIYRTVTQ